MPREARGAQDDGHHAAYRGDGAKGEGCQQKEKAVKAVKAGPCSKRLARFGYVNEKFDVRLKLTEGQTLINMVNRGHI